MDPAPGATPLLPRDQGHELASVARDYGCAGVCELLYAAEAPADGEAGEARVGARGDVYLGVAHVGGATFDGFACGLLAHQGQREVNHVARGLLGNALAHAHGDVEGVREVLGHEARHCVVRLVGDHGDAPALRAKAPEELGNAGVGVRVVITVDGVVRVELRLHRVDHVRRRAAGHRVLDETADAIANKCACLSEGLLGQACPGERVVDGEVEVLERVEEGAVEVEDDGAVTGHVLPFVVSRPIVARRAGKGRAGEACSAPPSPRPP